MMTAAATRHAAGGQPTSHSATLTVVVLVFNESLHIERCLQSVSRVADDVLVVDSYSTDDTLAKAEQAGVRTLRHPWTNYASQLNWALQHGDIRTEWVMRLDADELLDERLSTTLKSRLATAEQGIGGFEINRRIEFLGREIRHGGMAPMWVTRIWRKGWATCEEQWMDEHMVLLKGSVARLPGSLIDRNLNSITWWIGKHNHYASREAIDMLIRRYGMAPRDTLRMRLNTQAKFKRWLKVRLYSRLPAGARPWLYFVYRMFIRLGVLDGATGIMFHTLQGLWYRLLVDAKVTEIESLMKRENFGLYEAIHQCLNIDIDVGRKADEA